MQAIWSQRVKERAELNSNVGVYLTEQVYNIHKIDNNSVKLFTIQGIVVVVVLLLFVLLLLLLFFCCFCCFCFLLFFLLLLFVFLYIDKKIHAEISAVEQNDFKS